MLLFSPRNVAVLFLMTPELYLTGAYDPEGTLGNLTSIFMVSGRPPEFECTQQLTVTNDYSSQQVFLGLQSGRTLMAWKDHKNRVSRWYLWSVVIGMQFLHRSNAKRTIISH